MYAAFDNCLCKITNTEWNERMFAYTQHSFVSTIDITSHVSATCTGPPPINLRCVLLNRLSACFLIIRLFENNVAGWI